MKKVWFDEAWADYLYWQSQDKKTLKRINELLRDIERSNFDGIGKPEPLKGGLSGFWSRRIDATNRFVYRIENGVLEILSCKGHYEDRYYGALMCAVISRMGGSVRRQMGTLLLVHIIGYCEIVTVKYLQFREKWKRK